MDLGKGVSLAYDTDGYNYDMVVFQKEKPPLDSEMNLAQELQNITAGKNIRTLPSGWMSFAPYYADRSLAAVIGPNKFCSQNTTGAKPEFALVNGHVVHVSNTGSTLAGSPIDNVNIINLGAPPITGNRVTGVFLEVWRALLDPNTNYTNGVSVKPGPSSVIDTFYGIHMMDENVGWICGANGIVYMTTDGGNDWINIDSGTKRQLNGIHFFNSMIGWTVGEKGVILRTSNGGLSWNLLEESTIVDLNSVFSISRNIIWAVGDSGVMLKSTNGVTFVPYSSNVTYNLNKIFFADAYHGWAVGDGGNILMTTNGGVSWTNPISGTSENLNSVYFYNENYGFIVGNNGTILESTNGGSTWISRSGNILGGPIVNNLYDVTMVPKVDEEVLAEEVSSQLGSTGNTFTVSNIPITGKDRKGVTSNSASDVVVTVNDVEVKVDYINGTNGTILLAAPPGPGKVTKIHYYYKSECAVFQGNSWIVGSAGKILNTVNLGSTWTSQTSGTGFDLRAVDFVSQTAGWTVGAQSAVRATENGGTSWFGQLTDTAARQVQQVYSEGNNDGLSGINTSSPFLVDNMIHPDVNIETTKRVQVQYKIRIVEAVDPISNPEVIHGGLKGEGPNSAGSFYYENMGPINGDYGCWRAKCLNIVDEYVYAIPMFFVNRRNTTNYNTTDNPNGQYAADAIRPDFLTAYNVVTSDILDVRHKIINPSTEELFFKTFDALSANTLHTNFGRSNSGTFYGTELMQVDVFTGAASLTDAVNGKISSDSSVQGLDELKFATDKDPFSFVTQASPGIFHPDPSHYKAVYEETSGDATTRGKSIPGQFYGMGTAKAGFTINDAALMSTAVANYHFYADYIADSTQSLNRAPTSPQLVKNYSSSNQSYFYQGVLDSTSKILESWPSVNTSYTNYVVAYPSKDITDVEQQSRASNVEMHYFIKATSSGDSTTLKGGKLEIPGQIVVGTDLTNPYNIFTIKHVYNKTFPSSPLFRIQDVKFSGTGSSSKITIEPVAGYDFLEGHYFEIVASVTSAAVPNIRNGATVNFNQGLRSIENFVQSDTTVVFSDGIGTSVDIDYTGKGIILGWSTADTASDPNHAICWSTSDTTSYSNLSLKEITVQRVSPTFITLQGAGTVYPEAIKIQLSVQRDTLDFRNEGDTLEVAYYYNPPQSQNLSTAPTLSVDLINSPTNMYVSNLGSGGGFNGSPYAIPLEHIPVGSSISNDNIFNNYVQLKLANYFVDSGFLQLPINIGGNVSGLPITLSGSKTDALNRAYYSVCSKELKFTSEGLQLAVPRKVYVPVLARVRDNANAAFMKDEYVLLVFSRPVITEKENTTGYFSGGNCSIAVYRLANKPLGRS